ncbi:NAD(P)-binding protein [Polyplosphaeria fusca]|uniref:NAD(P)-binding protein n=1 Tax=Polyplosphaeria fusca TaxID=682080 RepID=A0A9P4R4D8_9PLEO|nr:NAD(P)-binding protein [Polyplosphaeria fusca]
MTGYKFDPNDDIPDLNGKVYVVTGGSAGIGYGIVAHLLQHNPSKIYLLSNKEEHAAEAKSSLQERGDEEKVEWQQCNLQSLKQTDEVAKTLAAKLERLDGLICNAGVGVGVYNETEDGLDSHMQVNHFAQAHLALTLLPLLQRTTDSRLVFQSSEMHRQAPSSTEFQTTEEISQDVGATHLYCRTKLAQVLFARELVKRIKAGQFGSATGDQGQPWINTTHPGAVKTDQPAQAVDAYGTIGKIGVEIVKPFMKDPIDEGCRSALFAATSEDIVREKIQGGYIVPDRKLTEVSKRGKDEALANNLWNLTKEVLEAKVGKLNYTM